MSEHVLPHYDVSVAFHPETQVRRTPDVLPERTVAAQIGIYSETSPLRTVALWGAPSVEAALAKLYPPEVSLFF